MNAVRSTVGKVARPLAARAQSRQMAIAATVKTAPDTSAMEFPAPSHVALSTQLAEVAEGITNFYSNSKSKLQLEESVRASIKDEIERKSKSLLTEMDVSTSPTAQINVPETVKIGDSPLFKKAK